MLATGLATGGLLTGVLFTVGLLAAAGRAGGAEALTGAVAGLAATGLAGWDGACAAAGLAGAGRAAVGLAGGAAFLTERIDFPGAGLLGAAA